MKRSHSWMMFLSMAVWISMGESALDAQDITLKMLLQETWDLERLTRMPHPVYKTVQFSSFDRRSTRPDSPDWFSNSDGFGNEPIPGFQSTIKQPDKNGIGRYLVCAVKGPGVVVRGWTAGINGTFRVFLDGAREPIYNGSADAFLRHRLEVIAKQAGVNLHAGRAFQQEDADYFPLPFKRGLRIEWEGNLKGLHFYQIGVRLYPPGTGIRTFRAEDVKTVATDIHEAAKKLLEPEAPDVDDPSAGDGGDLNLGPAETSGGTILAESGQARAIRTVELQAGTGPGDAHVALRTALLRIWFDGASVPQVEAPLGDFFGAAPGVNPYKSLPMEVRKDGTMMCRFVMPFRKSARWEVKNTGGAVLIGKLRFLAGPYAWDDQRSMYFRARWRVDHGLAAASKPADVVDMPYLMAVGTGRYVGTALSVMNPATAPSAWGNWWGEGDEKVFVDGEKMPSTFGTGSEDYFNYSWSRSHLFQYPYTVQPLVSGPDHRGYVTNIRWHVLDDLPFSTSLDFRMELWHHTPTPGLSYARIGYHYGRPGLRDDHPPIARTDLRVPALPAWKPLARFGTRNATFYQAESCKIRADGEKKILSEARFAGGCAVWWKPPGPGTKLHLDFETPAGKKYAPVLVMGCSPRGGRFTLLLDGRPVKCRSRRNPEADLSTEFQDRLTNFVFEKRELDKGAHTVTLVAAGKKPGEIIWDFFWINP